MIEDSVKNVEKDVLNISMHSWLELSKIRKSVKPEVWLALVSINSFVFRNIGTTLNNNLDTNLYRDIYERC